MSMGRVSGNCGDLSFSRLDRLVDRVFNGGVVPLLGAGVSMNAGGVSDFSPKLPAMSAALREKLQECFDRGSLCGQQAAPYRAILLKRNSSETVSSTEQDTSVARGDGADQGVNAERSDNDGDAGGVIDKDVAFEWLAESCYRIFGQQALCETLRIEAFARLQPTNAHRYIALICREGLIGEVITTNYDTCLEQALKGTFPRLGNDLDTGFCQVITTLEEYRRFGGLRWRDNPLRATPMLRLYKVNGCAKWYKDNPSEAASSILLTERQLQSHYTNPWKEDLLRDRCRSHNLLLSGFGSEEPQVRHLLVRLHGEFSGGEGIPSSGRGREAELEEVLRRPNAPFIAAYTQANFAHRQLMDVYLEANGVPRAECVDDNIFDGDDAERFSEGTQRGKLSADLFWEVVYQAVFKRLCKARLDSGSRFDVWLKARTPHACAWRNYLVHCLYPPVGDDDGKTVGELDARLGRYRALLAFPRGEPPTAPLPLMRLIRIMRGESLTGHGGFNWYQPLNNHPLTVLSTLLFLCLFRIDPKKLMQDCLGPCEKQPKAHPRGAAICLPGPDSECRDDDAGGSGEGDDCRGIVSIYLCHHRYQASIDQHHPRTSERLIYRIVIPGSQSFETERRWRYVQSPPREGEVGRIAFGREHDVCFSALIEKLGAPPDCDAEQDCSYQQKLKKTLLALDARWRDRRRNHRLRRIHPKRRGK